MGEDKKFECSKCPIYEACALAHVEIFGGVLAAKYGIDSYEECPYYRKCRNSKDVKECIILEIESEWESATFDEEYEEEW